MLSKYLMVALSCAACLPLVHGCDTPQNRAVAQDVYVATRGPAWTNSFGWLTDAHLSEWFGITCNGTDIIGIDLHSNNLNGTLTDSISQLVALQTLDLSNNQLTGELPSSWSALVALTSLYLFTNQLTGELPSSWSALVALQTLDLDSNQLTGELPSSWSALVALQFLYLSYNQLTGNFDACQYPNAFQSGYLEVNNNSFSGRFNFSCFNVSTECEALQENVFSGNDFCGGSCGLPVCNAACNAIAGTAADGPNIAFGDYKSQSECCTACGGTANCVAAEWFASTGVCFLKSAIGIKTASANTTLLVFVG